MEDESRQVVARMARVVVWRRWRVGACPMPRLEGLMKIQGDGTTGEWVMVMMMMVVVVVV